ncbi:D-alanyl-D-alanine carboxypeptidase/D-alanyl-D-alanine endopeptidase [Nocardioides sp. LHG3406-4]|uniref:D-alanyl-D-alanine carboxypeptidase/D-alanyl-D-alanine endopeptidase n=1 Tax=Nocardioides sp. LHG3406-4 TaxID=2804575 RepID=UPI003CF69703
MARRDGHHPAGRAYAGPGAWAHWLATLVVLALVGTAVAAYRLDWGDRLGWGADPDTDPAAVAPPAGMDLPELPAPEPVALPVVGSAVDPAEVTAALTGGLGDKDLGKHVVALVSDLAGGQPVFSAGTGAVTPASITKLLTTTAALAAYGPDATFSTRVVAGAGPHDIVLVGGGDPFLASKPPASKTYPSRADVITLVHQVASALTTKKVRLTYDSSLFTGPADNPAWEPGYVPEGIVSPITALWVDEGRDPSGYGRVADPARTAADVFAAALAAEGVKVIGAPEPGVAGDGAVELGAVTSAPLSAIVQRILDVSDNEAAEVLAHQVGLAVSGVGSFEAGAAGVLQSLTGLGIDTSGDQVYDGSGLSRRNRVTVATLDHVLRVAASPEQPGLRAVIEGLPVAGFTGSLTYRFDKGAPEGRGRVRAKTGTLTGVHSLAGVVTDLDGNAMSFVLAADRVKADKSLAARVALDEVAAALAACHCSAGPPVGATG